MASFISAAIGLLSSGALHGRAITSIANIRAPDAVNAKF